MSEKDYDLGKSSKKIGRLYPILRDANGNIIDGFHRQNSDPDWEVIVKREVDTPVKLELARLAANYCRRTMPPVEIENRIRFLINNDITAKEIAETIGVDVSTIFRHMPQDLKDKQKVVAGSARTCEQTVTTQDTIDQAEEKAIKALIPCQECHKETQADQITIVGDKPYCPKHAAGASTAYKNEQKRLEEQQHESIVVRSLAKQAKEETDPKTAKVLEAVAEDFEEQEDVERCRAFVRHIEEHIKNGDKGVAKNAKVVCKFCNKTIDEIWAEIEEKWKTSSSGES